MLDEKGNVFNVGRVLFIDVVVIIVGVGFGVFIVIIYVESLIGVIVGGRIGWIVIIVGILFLVVMFFFFVFIVILLCVIVLVLIYVGYLMFGIVKDIEFDNIIEGVLVFVIIVCMVLIYSIGDGLILGILIYVFVNIFYNIFGVKKVEDKKYVFVVMIVLVILFIIKFWLL